MTALRLTLRLLSLAAILLAANAYAINVTINPSNFDGLWDMDLDGNFVNGSHVLDLAPGQHRLRAGSAAQILFNVDAAGLVTLAPEYDGISAIGGMASLSLLTIPVTVDPGSYEGNWEIGRVRDVLTGHSDFNPGIDTLNLVPTEQTNNDGSIGAQYRFAIGNAGSALFVNLRSDGSMSFSEGNNTFPPALLDDAGVLRIANATVTVTDRGATGIPWRIVQVTPVDVTGDLDVVVAPANRYSFNANGASATFDVAEVCAVSPAQLDMNGVIYDLSCDSSDSVVDQENDPPINGQTACSLTLGTSGEAEPPGFAQTFTAGVSGTLSAIDFQLRRRSSYVGTELLLQIRSVDAMTGLPNGVIGERAVPIEELGLFPQDPPGFTRFDTSSMNVNVVQGERYAVSWTRVAIAEPNEKRLYIECSNGTIGDADGLYVGGAPFYSPDGGSSWNSIPFQSWTDFLFRTLVVPELSGPEANAGNDQSVQEGETVFLNGDESVGATSYAWLQVAGPTVNLSDVTAINPSFDAPYLSDNATLTFQLTASDGTLESIDTVDVTVVDVNSPPVADAGDDATIKEGAVATLNGTNSFDADGDSPLTFEWTQVGGASVVLVPDNTVSSPTFVAPNGIGTTVEFELVVDDGKESGTPDSVTIEITENTSPVADAGADLTVDEGAIVTLEGSGSADADGGDTLSYAWSGPLSLNSSTTPMPSFIAPNVPPGGASFNFDLIVTDDDPVNPKTSLPDTVTVNVRNINDPPSCDLARAVCPRSKAHSRDGCKLWPPNHKLVKVRIKGVTDDDLVHNNTTVSIISVTSDEPTSGVVPGDSGPDAVVRPGNSRSVLLRSERARHGNGRVYQINFEATDGFESCSGSVSVGVPRNRKSMPIDDGQSYDATLP